MPEESGFVYVGPCRALDSLAPACGILPAMTLPVAPLVALAIAALAWDCARRWIAQQARRISEQEQLRAFDEGLHEKLTGIAEELAELRGLIAANADTQDEKRIRLAEIMGEQKVAFDERISKLEDDYSRVASVAAVNGGARRRMGLAGIGGV